MRNRNAELIHEYFYRRFAELETQEDELATSIRHKKGLLVLALRLWELQIQKAALTEVYNDLKYLYR